MIGTFPQKNNGSSSSGLKGTWNASTNTPALANTDTEKVGFMYQVSTGGTVDFGAGDITFEAKDIVVNNGTVWDKIDSTDAVVSVAGKNGVVTLNKSDVGLPNVDNTSDTNKPVSSATSSALASKVDKDGSKVLSDNNYTTTEKNKLSNVEDNATANPNAFDKTADDLDDITEGATNKAFTNTLKNKLDNIEADAEVNIVTSVASKTGAVSLVKADVGLGNVDNTSDANKPVSSATQTALDGKAPNLSVVTKSSGYSLTNSDVDVQIRVTGTTTITLPNGLTWATDKGCEVVNVGADTVTITLGGSVTVNGAGDDITLEPYKGVVLMPISSNTYLGTGV